MNAPVSLASPKADPDVARDFLDRVFGHVGEPGLIEIAYSGSDGGAITRARSFENTPEGRSEAAQFAAQVNAIQGQNVYFAPSLRKMDSPRGKRAKKVNVLGSPMVWADFDDPGAAAASRPIYEDKGAPHSIVVTGTKPDIRAQGFWLCDKLVHDQNELDEMLAGVHVGLEFHADPKVVNADRVMRIPGCISWPKPGKEGRVAELTEHALPEGAPATLYTIDAIKAAYPPREPKQARKGISAEPGTVAGDLLSSSPPATPSPSAPSLPAQSKEDSGIRNTQPLREREFDMLGRRIDGRDEYAMQIIGGAIRNLAASLDRWPNAEELFLEAWPTYSAKAGPKKPVAGELAEAGLEREGRGRSWFWEKCGTHVRRATDGAIRGMETIAAAKQQAEIAAPGAPATPEDRRTRVSDRVAALRARAIIGSAIKPQLARPYIVKGWLEADTLAVTYGAPGSAKSFFLLDLVRHVVRGLEWRGHRVRQGRVLYIAGEGQVGILNRLTAAGGIDDGFVLLPAPVDLSTDDIDAEALVELFAEITGHKPDVIVVDTLARAMTGDENSSQDMGRLVRNCDLLREHSGAHVHLVHHSGKDSSKGGRGSSALLGAVDTEIRVERVEGDEGEVRVATITKQKDGLEGITAAFTLESVELGTDQDGEPVSSARVVHCDAPEGGARKRKLRPNELTIDRKYSVFVAEHGEPVGSGAGLPGSVGNAEGRNMTGVDKEAFVGWVECYFSHAELKHRKEAARRAISTLCDKGLFATGKGSKSMLWRLRSHGSYEVA